jgi:hypothetical protein
VEQDLFSRIRNLEALCAYGLPPQLHSGEYEQQIRNEWNTAVSIRDDAGILSRELQEMQIMELKRYLQERLFDFMISEPRLESIFPYRDIREDFLEEKAEHNISSKSGAIVSNEVFCMGCSETFFEILKKTALTPLYTRNFGRTSATSPNTCSHLCICGCWMQLRGQWMSRAGEDPQNGTGEVWIAAS